jgi:hypothetical protein
MKDMMAAEVQAKVQEAIACREPADVAAAAAAVAGVHNSGPVAGCGMGALLRCDGHANSAFLGQLLAITRPSLLLLLLLVAVITLIVCSAAGADADADEDDVDASADLPANADFRFCAASDAPAAALMGTGPKIGTVLLLLLLQLLIRSQCSTL